MNNPTRDAILISLDAAHRSHQVGNWPHFAVFARELLEIEFAPFGMRGGIIWVDLVEGTGRYRVLAESGPNIYAELLSVTDTTRQSGLDIQ